MAENPAETPRRRHRWTTLLVGVLSGFLVAGTATTSEGNDLRPDQTSDLTQLVGAQEQRNTELSDEVDRLNAEIAELNSAQAPATPQPELPREYLASVGLAAVQGPGVRVILTDAPADFEPRDLSPDLLVVHEHDIQVVVNALWAGGAEAMTIQGQRVVATTAVKCVGNTIVLHGKPYAPPYVIEAIGDQAMLEEALLGDPAVRIYRDYAEAYQLGYSEQRLNQIAMPAYEAALPRYARAER